MDQKQALPGRGAYGFELTGLDGAWPLLGPAKPGWPRLRVVRAPRDPDRSSEDAPPGTVRVGDDSAEIWIGDGGRVDVERSTLTVRFATAEPLEDQLVVHPYLALPASIASRWLGRQTLHGGALRRDGRAWALLGDKEAGKSSTLGWLLQRGHEILSDDILVLNGGVLYSGPRCVDLRPEAASLLGGENLGMLGGRVRSRLRSGDAPPSTPLGGVIHLQWGDRLAVEPLDPSERLAGLVRNSVFGPGRAEAAAYLDLAALPTWRFVRPRDLGELEGAGAQLLDAIG